MKYSSAVDLTPRNSAFNRVVFSGCSTILQLISGIGPFFIRYFCVDSEKIYADEDKRQNRLLINYMTESLPYDITRIQICTMLSVTLLLCFFPCPFQEVPVFLCFIFDLFVFLTFIHRCIVHGNERKSE